MRLFTFLQKRSLVIAGATLIVFISLITFVQLQSNGQAEEKVQELTPLEVSVMRYGESQVTETAVGTAKNLSSLTLVAQSNGPVAQVKVSEGQEVSKGTCLVQQTTAYGTANAATVQRQIAGKNYELASSSLENTVEVVSKTREQADLVRDNTEELRKLSEKSVDETKDLISLMEEQVEYLEDSIESAPDEATKSELRSGLIAMKGSLNQSRDGLRQLEYQVDTDNPPTKLAEIGKELVYKSTQLQLESAKIQKEIAALNLRAARIQEDATQVKAPISGTIEKVFVSEGEYLNPGTPAVVIKGQETEMVLEIPVTAALAARVNPAAELRATIAGNTEYLPVAHISQTAVHGQLYEVLTSIPEGLSQFVSQNESIDVELPLYKRTQFTGNSFIPLDSVFVTNTSRYVFVHENGIAVQKEIVTGEIVGDSIEVLTGLSEGEEVILDRRVTSGQKISVEILDWKQEGEIIELG